MDNNQTIKEIYRAVGNLDGKVDGINNRLDRMNGAIAKNVGYIDVLQKKQHIYEGVMKEKTDNITRTGKIVALIIGLITIAGLVISFFK